MNLVVIYFVSWFIFSQSHTSDVIEDFGDKNWTSCEEFLANTSFDVQSVINVDWKIFYFWNPHQEKSYNIRFSLPNPILVDRFKVELRNMDSAVNWTRAVLFMETSIDFSALYLSTDTPGKFVLIPSFAFQMDKIPLLVFALKTVEPGYLGILNCQYRLCYALAPVDKIPKRKEVTKAAESIGFRGDYNRSLLYNNDQPAYAGDKSGEDELLEVDKEEFDIDD